MMIEMIQTIHANLATLIWAALLGIGGWGMWLAIRREGLKKALLTAAMIAQIAVIFQAVLGTILWIGGGWPSLGVLHILLGGAASIFLFGVNGYLREEISNRAQWVFGAGVLLFFGVAFLATITG